MTLFYKAKELNINLEKIPLATSSEDERNSGMIAEFEQLARIAEEFDTLFGTHQKIIATLEKYESEKAMP